MASNIRPAVLPLSEQFCEPIHVNSSSLYLDAGTGNTKLLLYRMGYWEGKLVSHCTAVCVRDVAQLDPIMGNHHLDKLASDMVGLYFSSFVDKAVLGATEWRRRLKPEDPRIEEFCTKLRANGVDIVALDAQTEAGYEAVAIRFALELYSMYTKEDLGCEYYVSAGGGSLQFGSIHGDARTSFPIKVKEFSDQIWVKSLGQEGDVLASFDAHCSDLQRVFFGQPPLEEGTVLCMGSFFYSAKETRMANVPDKYQTYPIQEVLGEMKARLETYRHAVVNAPKTISKKEVRAYVALRVNFVFLHTVVGGHARILFKRDWAIGENTLRTTWTFGHFLSSL